MISLFLTLLQAEVGDEVCGLLVATRPPLVVTARYNGFTAPLSDERQKQIVTMEANYAAIVRCSEREILNGVRKYLVQKEKSGDWRYVVYALFRYIFDIGPTSVARRPYFGAEDPKSDRWQLELWPWAMENGSYRLTDGFSEPISRLPAYEPDADYMWLSSLYKPRFPDKDRMSPQEVRKTISLKEIFPAST